MKLFLVSLAVLGLPFLLLPNAKAQVVITQDPTNQTVRAGDTATLSISVTGTGPISYQWRYNGTNLPAAFISTVAGNGVPTAPFVAPVDGVNAVKTTLCHPVGVACDSAGNVFIADTDNNRIRRVGTNGIITTFAGDGAQHDYGDGGTATNASLFLPRGVAADSLGNVFIADSNNNRVRKVATNGIIDWFAGRGQQGYSGDRGPAIQATLSYPNALALDAAGNVFIADIGNNRIRKVATNGIITTIAGNGTKGYSGDGGPATNAAINIPFAIAVDSAGNLFIGDAGNYRVRRVGADGIISTLAGTGVSGFSGDKGPATSAKLTRPNGLAVDSLGNLFISDSQNNRIRRVYQGIISTVAGTGLADFRGDGGPGTNAALNAPGGIALGPSGALYISDSANNRIRRLEFPGPTLTLRNITLANAGSYDVIVSNSSGSVTSRVCSLTVLSPPSIALQPYAGTTLAGTNLTLTVGASGTEPLSYQWRKDGVALSDAAPLSGARAQNLSINPVDLTHIGTYDVVITNAYGSVTSLSATLDVRPFFITSQPQSTTNLPTKTVTFSVSASGFGPFGYKWQFNGKDLADDGRLSGARGSTLTISSLTKSDEGSYSVIVTNSYGSIYTAPAYLCVAPTVSISMQPASRTVPLGGKVSFEVSIAGEGPLYYRWQHNGTNLPNNIIETVAGNGTAGDGALAVNARLNYPTGVAVDAAGNVYIADAWNQRIRKIDSNGLITTVAGTGVPGFSGDGGPATNATLYNPFRVAVGGDGVLYISDSSNNRIRKVATDGIITTFAGSYGSGISPDNLPATNGYFNMPMGVAVSPLGELYIADYGSASIRFIDTRGYMSCIAGGNLGYSGDGSWATSATFKYPESVSLDPSGRLFISDSYNDRVRKVIDGIIYTVAGNGSTGYSGDGGPATNASLSRPFAAVFDGSGNYFIADWGNNRIRKVDSNGIITTVAGNGVAGFGGDGGEALNASLKGPFSMALSPSGALYIADGFNNRVRKISYLSFADRPVLTITNLTLADVGNYTLVASNHYGSVVTSDVATLTATLPPLTLRPGTNSDLQLSLWNLPNAPYVLQTATNLHSPIRWEPILTNAPDKDGSWQFTDTNLWPSTARFYRVILRQ